MFNICSLKGNTNRSAKDKFFIPLSRSYSSTNYWNSAQNNEDVKTSYQRNTLSRSFHM